MELEKAVESCLKSENLASEEGLIEEVGNKKCCVDCKTTKTPLWRSGPSGPKSLCNACGIRYRKKRPSGTSGKSEGMHKKCKIGKTGNVEVSDELKGKLIPNFGKEVKRGAKRRHWGEVERAALLLMALSCGAVFA